jgi:hypothetical protein
VPGNQRPGHQAHDESDDEQDNDEGNHVLKLPRCRETCG